MENHRHFLIFLTNSSKKRPITVDHADLQISGTAVVFFFQLMALSNAEMVAPSSHRPSAPAMVVQLAAERNAWFIWVDIDESKASILIHNIDNSVGPVGAKKNHIAWLDMIGLMKVQANYLGERTHVAQFQNVFRWFSPAKARPQRNSKDPTGHCACGDGDSWFGSFL